jgi:hypothetical protein
MSRCTVLWMSKKGFAVQLRLHVNNCKVMFLRGARGKPILMRGSTELVSFCFCKGSTVPGRAIDAAIHKMDWRHRKCPSMNLLPDSFENRSQNLRKASVNFVMSVCPSALNSTASTGGIFTKFYIREYFSKILELWATLEKSDKRKFNFCVDHALNCRVPTVIWTESEPII